MRLKCVPEDFRGPERWTETGEDGRFLLMGLRPGRWKVVAGDGERRSGVSHGVLDGATDVRIVAR